MSPPLGRRLLVTQLLDAGAYVLSFWSFALHALGDWRCHERTPDSALFATHDDATRGFAPHDEPALLWHSAHALLALIGVGLFYVPRARGLLVALVVVALVAAAGDVVAFTMHARDNEHEHTRALSVVYAGLAAALAASATTIATYGWFALQRVR
jgi:hypothetical protein